MNINPPNYPQDQYLINPPTHDIKINNELSKTFRISLLSASILSLVVSVYFWVTGDKDTATYTLIWVPSILSLGNLLEN